MVDDDGDQVCEVEFQSLPQKFDLVAQWEQALGTELVGIGKNDNAHGEVWIDSKGFVFGNSIIHSAFWLVGENFAVALGNLLSGDEGRPMLLESEVSAMHFGRSYSRADPEVLLASSPEFRRS